MSSSIQSLKRFAFLLGFGAFCAGVSSGQTLNVRSFHPHDGLAHEVVRDIVQGSDGSLWFATFGGGISRFDGIAWETFSQSDGLPSNDVRVLLPEGKKSMWAGTTNGIAYFDGDTWSAVSPTIPDAATPSVFCIAEQADGVLWFGTSVGRVLEFRRGNPSDLKSARTPGVDDSRVLQGTWSIVLDADLTEGYAVRLLLQVADRETWAAVDGLGVAVHDGERWRLRWGIDALGRNTLSLFQSHDGSMWAAGQPFLYRLDGQKWNPVAQVGPGPTCIAQSPSGELFVGTRFGLWVRREGEWENPSLGDDVPHPRVETVSCLQDGSTWIGTEYGAYRIAPTMWSLFRQATDGVPLSGVAFYADPDTPPVAVDTQGRLVRFDGEVWKPVARLHTDDAQCRTITRPYENEIWFLFQDRVVGFSLDQDTVTRSVPIPESRGLNSLFQTQAGRLYLLNQEGVHELVNGRWEPRPSDPDYQRGPARSMAEDQWGHLWVELDEAVECWEEDKVEQYLALREDLSIKHRVSAVYCDRGGRIWFATQGSGLVCWDGKSYERYTAQDGLRSDLAYMINQASDGTLWVSDHSLGVSSYRDGRWVGYARKEGLAGQAVRAIGEYPEGVIWLAIRNAGVARYSPTSDGPDTSIREYPQTIAPGGNGVLFFSGVDAWKLTPQEDLVFSWRVVSRSAAPDEVPWSAFSHDTVVVTPRLKPGHYTFQVRAADKDRNIDSTPAQVDFEVLLPVWRSTEFLVPVSILLVIACIAVALVYKKHRALRVSEKKYRDLVETMNDGLAATDENMLVTFVNDKFCEMLGYSLHEVLGRPAGDFHDDANKEILKDQIARRQRGERIPYEITFTHKNGEERVAIMSPSPFFDSKGGFRGSFAVVTDITERKRLEDELRRHRNHLEELVEERTGELRKANEQLRMEIVERKRAEAELRNSRGQMRALAARLESIREESRALIARELHDELGHALTGLKMDLAWLERRLSKAAGEEGVSSLREKTASMSEIVDVTIKSVRRIATELRPGMLDDLGLVAAVEWQAGEFEKRTGIACELDLAQPGPLDPEQTVAMFRIFQETLTNVARHANATKVHVGMSEEEESLIMEVSDNGRGISEAERTDSRSLGLLGIKERALILGGEVIIQGIPGKGTTVKVRIPLLQQRQKGGEES